MESWPDTIIPVLERARQEPMEEKESSRLIYDREYWETVEGPPETTRRLSFQVYRYRPQFWSNRDEVDLEPEEIRLVFQLML
jgi:hypothetical protein